MPTGRWKKLAIAGAILIVGIGTALVFRREHSAEAPAAAQAPEALKQSNGDKIRPRQLPPEPALAGRIEPYSPTAQTDSVRNASAGFSAERNPLQTDSPLKWQTVRRTDESPAAATTQPDRAIVDRPAGDSPAAIHGRASDERHKIVDGDTLAGLARRYLGANERSSDLFEYNRDVLVTPEILPIGKELRIPPRGFAPAKVPPLEPQQSGLTAVDQRDSRAQSRDIVARAPAIATAITAAKPPAQTYIVQQHDTLALIARKLYGDIARQADLLAANRLQLRSAQDLRPGMTLVVPAAPRDSRLYDGLPRPSN
jgi:nucleoid-associated protein YgaU